MRTTAGAPFALIVLAVVGCGSQANLGTVKGKVTVDGQPIEGVRITFEPQFKGGSSSIGETDAQGNYTAKLSAKQEGVMVGKHNVRIRAVQYDAEGEEKVLAKIPPEYDTETKHQFEVKPGGNTFDLDVKTK